MTLTARIGYIKEPVMRRGYAGEYSMQGVRLDWDTKSGERQSLFGQFFGNYSEAFQRLGAQPGEMITVNLIFSVTEYNGYVKSLVEFRNPQRVSDVDVAEGLCAEDV